MDYIRYSHGIETLKLNIHLYSIPLVPRLVFFFADSSRKNEAPHSRRLQSAQLSLFAPHPFLQRHISDFLASFQGPILSRSFDVTLPLHRVPNWNLLMKCWILSS
ncbi:hypothetical protein AVEN_113932-1 [Araneus ventricosus]|uniref:Uncharacterized protein n=1 Tax=Araneus ventricosus TaxID=182803 RepID=A0A4Y2SPS4_ARAVE|nr:hypothetical protein AVEN_113932-1 [Araneus ventricosus]